MCACTARFNVLQRFLSLCLLCRSVPSERHALLWLFSLCRSAVTTNPIPYANVQAIGGVIYGSVSFVGMSNMVGVNKCGGRCCAEHARPKPFGGSSTVVCPSWGCPAWWVWSVCRNSGVGKSGKCGSVVGTVRRRPLRRTTLPPPLQMAVMPLVGMERVVFYRERAASYYNTWSYGLVMSMVELPYQLVQV